MKKIDTCIQSLSPLPFNSGRRKFICQTGTMAAAALLPSSGMAQCASPSLKASPLIANPLGFNGERKDPVTGCYHLGNGYRMYNPRLMRFHAADSMSPFGKGGINSYAYCLGDPVNRRDPSGHFAIMSLIIGAIVGAVVGAGISAATEGIRAAASGDSFDWKQVGIGAALGFVSGGIGAAAVGAKTGVQVGLAVADAVVSGASDFGLNVAAGTPVKQAGINAGIGAVVGLATFGVGQGVGRVGKSLSAASKRITRVRTIGLSGRGAPSAFKNRVDTHISEALSSVDKADFIWVRNVHTSNLNPVAGYHSPNEGSVALFMHSDGEKLLIKGRPYNPTSVANKITGLDGFTERNQEPFILAACKAAKSGHSSVAQQFADSIRRPVVATEGYVHISTNSERTILTSLYSNKPFLIFNPIPTYL
ncbi:RHS repeat-associated core domain-containing protein [Vibrio paucivorans]|uniref:RHS repeat-associated core domain-containing protein n=1 Tax=Vibrio paucivorans TaxID=2829489 RepID=A0A9X3CKJ3_9VIBR|nr:RHS repeat-associated core domain-containing protein [Vibrio paucivorans]MCW8336500.1 RHS repeat-associated core domain-containing protein [Vibrio paucivorans]